MTFGPIARRTGSTCSKTGRSPPTITDICPAASVAGLLAHGADDAQKLVCVLTGHGLKDPQTALGQAGAVVPCEPDIAAVEAAVLR